MSPNVVPAQRRRDELFIMSTLMAVENDLQISPAELHAGEARLACARKYLDSQAHGLGTVLPTSMKKNSRNVRGCSSLDPGEDKVAPKMRLPRQQRQQNHRGASRQQERRMRMSRTMWVMFTRCSPIDFYKRLIIDWQIDLDRWGPKLRNGKSPSARARLRYCS
jgi:hypothetical protein